MYSIMSSYRSARSATLARTMASSCDHGINVKHYVKSNHWNGSNWEHIKGRTQYKCSLAKKKLNLFFSSLHHRFPIPTLLTFDSTPSLYFPKVSTIPNSHATSLGWKIHLLFAGHLQPWFLCQTGQVPGDITLLSKLWVVSSCQVLAVQLNLPA